MSGGPNKAAVEQLAALVQATTTLLHQATPVEPQALLGLVAEEVYAQSGYEQILTDLTTPATRDSHPFWGFYIAGVNQTSKETVEIARTVVPKVLNPKDNPEYLPQVAAWTNTYMLAITPAARAAWRALGFTVTFFQTAQAPNAPAKPKLTLVS